MTLELKAESVEKLPSQVVRAIDLARTGNQKIVLVTGVFDLLHDEHQNFLRKASQRGDVLIVGLESDLRVRQLKGEGRPIDSEQTRLQKVLSLPEVSVAFILPDEFSRPEHHRGLIATIRPDVLAVSSHSPHLDKKRLLLGEFGGSVEIVHKHNPRVSTTQILNDNKK